ncbi:MAG: hypothetical protein ABW318_25950 [Vicinamibacterales bacterium]
MFLAALLGWLDREQRDVIAYLREENRATLVTPDTILRWHRELVARKWTYARQRPGRLGVRGEIRRLVIRMATESELGLHANPGGVEKCRASCSPVDDCGHPQGRGHSAER